MLCECRGDENATREGVHTLRITGKLIGKAATDALRLQICLMRLPLLVLLAGLALAPALSAQTADKNFSTMPPAPWPQWFRPHGG